MELITDSFNFLPDHPKNNLGKQPSEQRGRLTGLPIKGLGCDQLRSLARRTLLSNMNWFSLLCPVIFFSLSRAGSGSASNAALPSSPLPLTLAPPLPTVLPMPPTQEQGTTKEAQQPPSVFAQPDAYNHIYDFPGSYSFHVFIEEGKNPPKKAAPYTYSQRLDKLFVQLHEIVPITIRMHVFPLHLSKHHIRATVIFEHQEDRSEVVERCPDHIKTHKVGNQEKHLLRCLNPNTSYTSCVQTGRHSLIIPLDAPQAGCDFVINCFQFMCFSSCRGSINRRPILVVFSLESHDCQVNLIYGRKALRVRVCACPGRDRQREEANKQPPTS